MSSSYTTSPTNTVETRSVEQSILAATESMGRAEYLLERLHAAVTGYETTDGTSSAARAIGLVHDADRLASRLESFCADLERTSARITSGNVQSLAGSTMASRTSSSDQLQPTRHG